MIRKGDIFGRLTVVSCLKKRDKWYNKRYRCICICGTEIKVLGKNLKNGCTSSCGCLRKERMHFVGKVGYRATHRMSYSVEYQTWLNMIQRCTNPKRIGWQYWGGRGIKVCRRWLDSFENFYMDMGPKPLGLSLDRKDNNKNYNKENCRWATRSQQNSNRRWFKCA
jgi:hypothetical protein